MRSFCILSSLVAFTRALDGIVAPSTVVADQQFEVTFVSGSNDTSDQFRVFLAAAATGQNGPMCYLQNSTTLTSPFTATIPASVGPDGTDYSIAIADLTTSEGATYGNRFNLTGATGVPTDYETHLDGKPFWDGNKLPCSAVPCARLCAQANYPSDLTDDSAYANMVACIEKCPGVTADATATKAADSGQGNTVPVAVVTLGVSQVVTAYETVVSTGSVLLTEAVIGSQTLTLGSAAVTVDSASLSLAASGLYVGGTSLVAFTTAAASSTSTSTSSTSATSAAAATTSSAGFAGRLDAGIVLAGGLAMAAALV